MNPFRDKIFREFMLGKYWWLKTIDPRAHPKLWVLTILRIATFGFLFLHAGVSLFLLALIVFFEFFVVEIPTK